MCVKQKDFPQKKWAPCPSLRPHLPIDWPCIRAVELCNGNRDCPNGEDEEPNMCMFHSLNQGSLRQLQRDFLRFSAIYGIRLTKVKLSLGDPLDQQSSSNVQFDTVDKCEHSNGRRRMKKL
ncbi:unnamed protein product, partial [Mesorhabditis belari]|uniref:Uncharacterized protein n=1 Tax=Mesorhabditis belari TaxID=2138241 RepID=A0AAF3J3I2_9BILA